MTSDRRVSEDEERIMVAVLRQPDRADSLHCTALDFSQPAYGKALLGAEALRAKGEQPDIFALCRLGVDVALALQDVYHRWDGMPVRGLEQSSKRVAKAAKLRAASTELHAAGDWLATLNPNLFADALSIAADRAVQACSPIEVNTGSRMLAEGLEEQAEAACTRVAGELRGVTTGIRRLDDMTCGLEPGLMSVLCGRPAMGKSAFALGVCLAASAGGAGCLFASVEMPPAHLFDRVLANQSGVSLSKIRSGVLRDDERMRLREASKKERSGSIEILDAAGWSVGKLRVETRTRVQRALVAADPPPALLVVDYLQIMSSDKRGAGEYERVSEASLALLSLARELELHVMAVSQLNRKLEERSDKRPLLGDLRSSGQIEQDASTVMALYRDEVYDEHTVDKGVAEVIVRKARQGVCGTVRTRFDGAVQRFGNIEQEGRREWT